MNESCHNGGCGCGAGCAQGYRRHYFTKAERIENLKTYAEDLRKELKAVEEEINKPQN